MGGSLWRWIAVLDVVVFKCPACRLSEPETSCQGVHREGREANRWKGWGVPDALEDGRVGRACPSSGGGAAAVCLVVCGSLGKTRMLMCSRQACDCRGKQGCVGEQGATARRALDRSANSDLERLHTRPHTVFTSAVSHSSPTTPVHACIRKPTTPLPHTHPPP